MIAKGAENEIERDQTIRGMLSLILEIQEDSAVPRNVKERLQFCNNALQDKGEFSLRLDKVRHALEEISDDSNLQPYTRTQLWNIACMLERM